MARSKSDVWQKNFALALQEDIDLERGCSVGQAIELLHDYFTKVMSGAKGPSDEDTKVFYAVKNGALALLSARLHQDANRSLVMAYDMGVAKNGDYGIDNIPKYGVIGVTVRLNDKLVKVASLMRGPRIDAREERLRRALIDVVNYSTYAMMLYRGAWQ